MKKTLFIAALAIAALASCSENEFVGETPSANSSNEVGAISFTSGSNAVTRALSNAASAELLDNNFVLFGRKTDKEETPGTSTVFNNYQANYVTNTANSTESNSSNWEYVSYYNVPNGVTTNDDVPTFAASSNNTNKIAQTIKYWDYNTNQYDFAAYSLGKGASSSYAKASAISFDNLGTNNEVFTLTGTADQLKACYISDLVTAYNHDNVSDYGKPVQFSFRSLAAKIRIAFYETIPGYSVKDIQFYSVATGGSASTTPTLFTSTAVLPSGSGIMKVSYPTTGFTKRKGGTEESTDYNKAHVTFEQASETTGASTLTFEALKDFAAAEVNETSSDSPATGWIGRASNAATYAGGMVDADNDNSTPTTGKYYSILPYETGANLQLRIKYTLVSTDYSEIINVDNATAVVPAELAKWSPNYAYTYIFKIGDMTNGSTGEDGEGHVVTGLTPITLDAVVVDSEEGVQETITTVSEPSITTYMAGKVITDNDEYIVNGNHPIYIVVNNGLNNQTLTKNTNAKLYEVTISPDPASINLITEEAVDNALRYGVNSGDTYVVTDAKTGTMTVTDVTNSKLAGEVTKILAADSPTGNDINVPCATFVPESGKTYAFQYLVSAETNTPTFTAVESVTTLTNGTKYYTSSNGDGEFQATGHEKLDGVYYTKNGNAFTQVTGVAKLTENETYYPSGSDENSFVATGKELVGGYYYIRSGEEGNYKYNRVGYLVEGNTYYTSERGSGKFVATGSEAITTNTYWEITAGDDTHPAKYQYKIIKVE